MKRWLISWSTFVTISLQSGMSKAGHSIPLRITQGQAASKVDAHLQSPFLAGARGGYCREHDGERHWSQCLQLLYFSPGPIQGVVRFQPHFVSREQVEFDRQRVSVNPRRSQYHMT